MNTTIRIDRAALIIPAPAEAVYAAMTDADAVARWLPPAGMRGEILTFEPRPGGTLRMVLVYEDPSDAPGKTDAGSDHIEGNFISLEENRTIIQAFRFVSDDPAFAGLMRMTWTLDPAPEGTMVLIAASDVPHGIDAGVHEEALAQTLDNLAAWLAESSRR